MGEVGERRASEDGAVGDDGGSGGPAEAAAKRAVALCDKVAGPAVAAVGLVGGFDDANADGSVNDNGRCSCND